MQSGRCGQRYLDAVSSLVCGILSKAVKVRGNAVTLARAALSMTAPPGRTGPTRCEEAAGGAPPSAESSLDEGDDDETEFFKYSGKLEIPLKDAGVTEEMDPRGMKSGVPVNVHKDKRHALTWSERNNQNVEDDEDPAQHAGRQRYLRLMQNPVLTAPVSQELITDFSQFEVAEIVHVAADTIYALLDKKGRLAMSYDLDRILPWGPLLKNCKPLRKLLAKSPAGEQSTVVRLAIMEIQRRKKATDRWILKSHQSAGRESPVVEEKNIVYWREETIVRGFEAGLVKHPTLRSVDHVVPGGVTGIDVAKTHFIVNCIQLMGKDTEAPSPCVIFRGWSTIAAAKRDALKKSQGGGGGGGRQIKSVEFDLVTAELIVKGKVHVIDGVRWHAAKGGLHLGRQVANISSVLEARGLSDWTAKLIELSDGGRMYMGERRDDEGAWCTVRHGTFHERRSEQKGKVCLESEHPGTSHMPVHIATLAEKHKLQHVAEMNVTDYGTTCLESNTAQQKFELVCHNGMRRRFVNSSHCGCNKAKETGCAEGEFITCGATDEGKKTAGLHKARHAATGDDLTDADEELKQMVPVKTCLHAAHSFARKHKLDPHYFEGKMMVDVPAGSQTGYRVAAELGARYWPADIRTWVETFGTTAYNHHIDLLPERRLEYAKVDDGQLDVVDENLGLILLSVTCHGQTAIRRDLKRGADGRPMNQWALMAVVQLQRALVMMNHAVERCKRASERAEEREQQKSSVGAPSGSGDDGAAAGSHSTDDGKRDEPTTESTESNGGVSDRTRLKERRRAETAGDAVNGLAGAEAGKRLVRRGDGRRASEREARPGRGGSGRPLDCSEEGCAGGHRECTAVGGLEVDGRPEDGMSHRRKMKRTGQVGEEALFRADEIT